MSDKKKRQPRAPQAIRTPGQLAQAKEKQAHALANKAEIDEILGMKGAQDGD